MALRWANATGHTQSVEVGTEERFPLSRTELHPPLMAPASIKPEVFKVIES